MLSNVSIEKSFDPKMLFWVLLGPFFIIFTLLVSSLQEEIFNKDLWAIAILGIGLCAIFQRKGLILTLVILVALSLLKHFRLPSHHLWQLGLEVSFLMGFVITYFSFDFLSHLLSSFEIRSTSLEQKHSLLEEELVKEEEFFARQKKGWQDLIEEKEKNLQALTDELNSLLQEKVSILSEEKKVKTTLEEKEKLISFLEKKALSLQMPTFSSTENDQKEKLTSLEKTKSLLELENKKILESLNKTIELHSKEKEDLLTQISSLEQGMEVLKKIKRSPIPPQNPEDKEIRDLYKQLKRQFSLKDEELHLARKEAHLLKEKDLAKERESKENFFKTHPKEKEFVTKVAKLQDKLESVISENNQLQSLVTTLNDELAKKWAKGKKTPPTDEQLSLYF